ncbi:MAG: glucose-6-phosphate dehydrogenase assembly protein OpcA [Dehalococcoidia bacterium]
MASDVTAIERLEDRPIPVDPAAIEDEFTRIWRETAGGYDESSVRLRVMNLVGVGAGEDALGRFESLMEVLPQRHPCRGILALVRPGLSRVSATISAHSWRSASGGRNVCSEEVLIFGPPADDAAMPSLVLALLVPELSVICWRLGPEGDSAGVLEGILDAADVLLFDSAQDGDTAAAFRWALRLGGDHGTEPRDLAWGRLTTWRELIAQSFDDDDGPNRLREIASIEIEGGGGRPGSEALLLAGWIVSRLGLTPADVETGGRWLRATLYAQSRAVTLSVIVGEPNPPGLHSVRLRSGRSTLLVEHHAASGHMHVREESPTGEMRAVEQIADQEPPTIARMLDEGRDDVYLEALRDALALLG